MSFIMLMIVLVEKEYNSRYWLIGMSTGFFILSFILFIHKLGSTLLSISAYQIEFTSMALNKDLGWLASPTSANTIIAVVCIFGTLIFWLLGMAGLQTKKITMGITVILFCIFFLELFFIFINPEQSALRTGWYRGAVEFFGQSGVEYLSWLLTPLMIVALMEQTLSVFTTLGFALGICLMFNFGVDFVLGKAGLSVRGLRRMVSRGK